MSTEKIVLETNSLTKRFGGVLAVDDFSCQVADHQIVGIIGPNGAGKTTSLNLISGLYPPDSGAVRFLGEEITGSKPYEIGRKGIARTFQNIRLFAGMTVAQTVSMAYSWRADYGIVKALLGVPQVGRYERRSLDKVWQWLDELELTDYGDDLATSLPYGLQRRVELARALANEPRLLLLDEPGAGLNVNEVFELIDLVQEIHERLGLAMIIIEHRMDIIMQLCDWIYVLDFGKTIGQGTPEQVQNDPIVIQAYLGDDA